MIFLYVHFERELFCASHHVSGYSAKRKDIYQSLSIIFLSVIHQHYHELNQHSGLSNIKNRSQFIISLSENNVSSECKPLQNGGFMKKMSFWSFKIRNVKGEGCFVHFSGSQLETETDECHGEVTRKSLVLVSDC